MNRGDGAAHSPDVASVTMQCVQDVTSFRGLEQEWQRLHARCPDATPFNTWEWLFSWWQAYGGARRLRLLTCRSDGELVGVAPLCVSTENTRLGTHCEVLRFVGDGSFDSDYLGFLILPAAYARVMEHIAEWLSQDKGWHVMVLSELPDRSPLPGVLRDYAQRLRLRCRIEYRSCGVLDLPRSLEDYLRERQSRFRTKLRALLRRLDAGELAFERDCEPRELRRKLRSLFALHQRRWHESGEPGVFGAASKRRFYAGFVPRFARRGWLRLYSLRMGTTYVAHQLCFGGNGTTFLLQEGFDVSDPAASYGQMLRAAVIRELIQAGESRYDFLGGFSKHKADWGAREEKSVHLTVARRTWRAWLYFQLPLWRERFASEAKRILPAPLLDRLR